MMSPADADFVVSRTLWARGGKRAVDFVLGLAGAIALAPFILLGIVAMKLTSPGPALFRQERTGRGGTSFHPYKLRTMRADWKHNPNEIVPLNHHGITRVGRLLRRLKIDEMPQILNVVNGQMALVGPRPTLPDQTREYDDFKRRRLLIRPGMTGLAQVNGNASVPWDERIKYDVYYVQHHNLMMDVGIFIKTVAVVFLGEERFSRPFAESRYARG